MRDTSFTSERQQVLDWLKENGCPVLPVAPAQDPYKYHKVVKAQPERDIGEHCPLTDDLKPVALFSGKNPSFLDKGGKPHLVNHRQYQDRIPAKSELRDWFGNTANNLGTLGGWHGTVWLDFDLKQFASQEDCDRAAHSILERPELQGTFIERTHSGGWRIGVRVKEKPEFTNFALEPGGVHVGEALGAGRFTVISPSIGASGSPYVSINRVLPVEIESLESIGIYSTRTLETCEQQTEQHVPPPATSASIPGSIPLEMLGNDASRAILGGDCPTGDRSEALATAAKEWYGWQNWSSVNGISVTGDASTLAHHAGSALGLDSDRIDRILKSINPGECRPAALFRGGENSCWKKIHRLDQVTFEANCPVHTKDAVASEWKKVSYQENSRGKKSAEDTGKQKTNFTDNGSNNGGNGGNDGNGGDDNSWNDGDEAQGNKWNAPVSWNSEIGYWFSKKRNVTEVDPVTGETKPVYESKIDPDTGEVKQTLGRNKQPIPRMETVSVFYPKTNFDFQVERELSSETGGGLVLQIQRSVDGGKTQKRIVISSLDYGTAREFEKALKKALGAGIVINLKDDQVRSLVHVRTKEYRDRGGRLYRLAERVGQQSDGTWVFPNIQFSRNGEITTEEDSGWVFNPNLGEDDKIPAPEIAPPDKCALPRLVSTMEQFHGKEGVLPAIVALGYGAASVHFQEIMKREKHFPLINLLGDPGSNKSIASQNMLSLFNWHDLGLLHRLSVSAVYQWLKLTGSIPSCLDDPQKSPELDELFKGLYDGRERVVRGNIQKPHSPLTIASNHAIGDNQPATLSRMIQLLFFKTTDGDSSAWDAMQEAQRMASGALPDLIKLGYPAGEIRKLANELRGHLPHAHARVADSLALVGWYAMAIARLANFSEEKIKSYVLENLCKSANDADSKVDSLTDFIDKLHSLQSESLAGEWSIKLVETTDIGKTVAVAMSTVWPVVDKLYSPRYSRKVLESLIDKAGGKVQSTQKFYKSKDETLAYQRLLLQPEREDGGTPKEPERVTRRCVLIPASLCLDFIANWQNPVPPGSGGGTDGGNSPTPTSEDDNPQLKLELNSPVTPVTSSHISVTEKCDRQNQSWTRTLATLDSPVTFSEKNILNKKEDDSSASGDDLQFFVEADSQFISTHTPTHTPIPEKNVTGEFLEAECQAGRGLQRSHNGCDEHVTECDWHVTEGVTEAEVSSDVRPESSTGRDSATECDQYVTEAEVSSDVRPDQPKAETSMPTTNETVTPELLAAKLLKSQTWSDLEELVNTVSAAIDTPKAEVFRLTVRHINKSDRQHLVNLLAEHIKQYPRDQWAYNWVPSQKLISKATALAKGTAPEEVADTEDAPDYFDPESD